MEEIHGVTWGLDGAQLEPWQAAQRLYKAGFADTQLLCKMLAVIRGESGWYLKAWHHNVLRDADGNIQRTADGKITIKSTDLGFIQRNVVHTPPKVLADADSQAFVDQLFLTYPELARGDESAKIAWNLYKARGFQPWYAYTNGGWKNHLEQSCLAVGNYVAMVFLRKSKLLRINY